MDGARDYINVLYQGVHIWGSVLGKISFGSDWFCAHQFEHSPPCKISIPLFFASAAPKNDISNPSNRQGPLQDSTRSQPRIKYFAEVPQLHVR
ncbi:hypothetical protein PVAP13_9NG153373 [Panicum virgatum]|uniref:Uncharacterized protein n=1 Tax=Panicum virgatum TaxID=38727 RepID=A0A8T0ML62_PANVG|nr:hypothetical protein PVAP13_9NG153373 [Panicum virgatum]